MMGMPVNRKIRVLIVDDSAIVRKILSEALSAAPDIEVAGTAPDPIIAAEKIRALNPDVLTLDIEMPRMDGLTFLKGLMQSKPLPAIIISSLAQPSCRAAVQALELGAVEVLAKPAGPFSIGELRFTLAAKVRAAASARLRRVLSNPVPPISPQAHPVTAAPLFQRVSSSISPNMILAIGASTGGTEAIASIVTRLPADCPPVVVAQHIPPLFSHAFAERLNGLSAPEVKEAVDNDAVQPGRVLVAPGDFHMVLRKSGGRYYVNIKTGPQSLLPASFGGRTFLLGSRNSRRFGRGCLAHGYGFGRRPGIAAFASGRRAYHRPGRSHLRGFRDASRSHRSRCRHPGAATVEDRAGHAFAARETHSGFRGAVDANVLKLQ